NLAPYPLSACPFDAHALADWIIVPPVHARGQIAYDGHIPRIGAIVLIEYSAAEQRNVQALEVAARYSRPVGLRTGLARPGLRTAFNAKAPLVVDPAQGHRIRSACGVDARDRPNAPQRLFKEICMFRLVGITRAGEAHDDAEHICGPKARIDADDMSE